MLYPQEWSAGMLTLKLDLYLDAQCCDTSASKINSLAPGSVNGLSVPNVYTQVD